MRISRCGLPPIHNKGLAFRNGGGAMIEAFLKWLLYRFLLQCCTNRYLAEKNAPS